MYIHNSVGRLPWCGAVLRRRHCFSASIWLVKRRPDGHRCSYRWTVCPRKWLSSYLWPVVILSIVWFTLSPLITLLTFISTVLSRFYAYFYIDLVW